jgi:hypothetical protein
MFGTKPTKTEAIYNFLHASTHADLANRYHAGMEVQVNVAPDGGTQVEGTYLGRQWNGFQGPEGQVWKAIRIPWKANTEPEFEDSIMSYDLAAHADGIGMTGWNWQQRRSEWWGFDFDAIKGHAESHTRKLSDADLREIQQAVAEIPWVTVRKSTSGKGLHLYVYCEGFPTSNHNEHAAVARAILSHMSAIVGFDFQGKADTMGGNMWIWHRKMIGTDGLTLLKQGSEIPISEIPLNWRDHIQVVSGKRVRNMPQFIAEMQPLFSDADKIFEQICGQRLNIPLDAEHRKLIDYLQENGCRWWWDSDYHMLVTHTVHLKEAHEALQLKGIFETLSQGTQRGSDHNCYAFPLRDGAWVVRRYSPGTGEAPSWDQDQAGYTRCYYNRKPDLKTAARACEGVEQLNGSFVFSDGDMAEKAAMMLGTTIGIPNHMRNRNVELRQKEGLIGVDLQAVAQVDNAKDMKGWAIKAGKWRKTVQIVTQQGDSSNMINYDDTVRHLVNESDEDSGWIISSDNIWRDEPYKHVQVAIESTGYSSKDAKIVMGTAVLRPWRIVNIPFGPEYPGDRSWNRNAARFNVTPAEEIDSAGCPHWMKMLNHLGKGLDEAIEENGWCKANGIKDGATYLKTWVASMIQKPLEPLPYLFFYSPEENTGKSTFHESMSFLIRNGIEFADTALTQQQTFNAELAKAVLCVVEETSLQNHKQALARIRAWVTNRRFPVHPKFGTPYSIPNSTHWVQFSNDLRACPIFQGDTRITMLTIQPLEPTEIIPKKAFFDRLEKEAPYFLAELLKLELPPSNDRLAIPIITTSEKQALQAMNESLLETFLREKVHHIPGALVPVGEMWEKFYGWMDEHDRDKYTKIMMGKEMPSKYPKGRWRADWYYGNVSFEPKRPGEGTQPAWIVRGEKLVQVASKVS